MTYDFSSLDEQKATPKQAQSKYDFSSLDPAPQSHVEASLYSASFANPVEASSRLDAANKLKTYLGEDWAPSIVDPAEAQRRLRIAENDHVLRNSPALSRKFIESGYAERTFDDLKPLSGVEAAVKSVFGVAKQSGSAVASSLWSANSGLWGLGRMAADVVGTVLPDDTANEISGWFAGYQKATGKTAQEMLGDPKDQGFTERSVYQGLQSLGQNLLTLPLAYLTGGASATLLPMVGMTGGSEYGKARDKGVSIPNSLVYGASQAAVEYATEKLPVTKFLGDIKAGTPFMQMLMKQVAYEVPGEQVATLLQDLNEWAVVNPEKSFASYVEERPSAAAQTLIATIVGVGGQVSTVKGVETLVGAVTGKDKPFADPLVLKANAAERTLQAEQTLTQLIDAVAGTQSIQRNPQDVADLISEADESGQTEVFINARQFANVFNQSAIETADRLGIDTQTLNDALASNGDLTVPLASLATTVAQDEALRPILEHTRVDPGDMSPSEARLWQSSQGEQFKAEAEAVLAQRQADEVYQTEVQGVYDNLLGQLNTARRFTPQVNERYASMVRDFYVTMSDRAGMSVSEMAARYPLRVQAQGVGGLEQGAIESPEFRNWFGESKVVDDHGKPLVVYHGTRGDFDTFDAGRQGQSDFGASGRGFYFSQDPGTANVYATLSPADGAPNIVPVYLKLENPLGLGAMLPQNEEQSRALTEAAKEAGHDGIVVRGADGVLDEVVVFRPEQIKSAIGNNGNYDPNDANILKQDARGSFNPDTNTIGLLENADLSTFLHESGHFFLEVMADMATRPDAAPAMRADFDTLLGWFGVTGTPEADPATTWHLMSLEEKRQFHEQFARGFEAYLFEGTAPSVEMQGIFQRFRAWLTNVYESLKALDVTLTDDVRGVFDRMLASDEAIKTAEAVRNFAPVFQTPEQAGMTAEEWAQYQGEAKEASDNAVSELQTRSIRDMRWLANAKARKIKDLQATAKAVRNDVMMDVRREVLSEPIYMAWQFLTGKNPDKIAKPEKTDPAAIDPTKDTLLVAIAKLGGLDREQVIKEWGMDSKDDTKADNPGGKTLVTRKGGMGIDDMRLALEEWGYLPDSSDPATDPKVFEELFFDALAGGEYYSQWGEEAMIAAEMRKSKGDPEAGITLENTPAGKLNTGALKDMYGETDTAPWRLLSALRMTSPEGFHPDTVANIFGFSSGDELVRRLAVAEDPKIVIEAKTDQRMLEQHGDLASEADIERAAERAIHNDVRARVLTRELNALRKATGQAPIMLKAARLHADTWLARQLVKNATRHAPHAAAESRSAKAAMDALAKGDTASAAIHKRDQVLNNQLARGALRAQDEVEKAVRYLKKFDKKGTRKALDQQYLDQIDQLLERFDLRAVSGKALQKRASLAGWLAEQESLGLDPVIDGRLVEDAQRQHFSTLTLEEFRGLVDSVKSIEHLGRLKHQLLTAKDKREFAKVVAELSESVVDNANRDVTTVNAITPLEKGAKLLRGFSAMHRKFASIIREMDGGKDGGPMWEYLVRTMNEAGDKEVSLRGTMSERFAAVFAGLKGIKLNEKVFVPELNISLRREELLAIALNSGNEGNLQRLMDGGINDSLRAVSGQQLMGLLNRLSNKEWDFVEGVWSMIAINRPAIAAQEKALTGVEPKWVEPSPFTLQSGRVIMGGYYPAKYNADMSTRSNELEAITDLRQQMSGAAGRASTRNGYAKERAEAVAGRPLRLDLGVIAQHINEVTHRLSWQAWLIDARRIIAAPAVDRAIRDHYGPEILDQMRRQLKDIAAGDNGPTDAMDRVMNHLRNGTTIAGMGWNIMTSLMQPIGLTQSIERVGAGWIAKGLGQFVVSPFEITKDVHERSAFMRNRAKTVNREVNDVLNTIRSERMSKVEGSYFYLIQKFQQMVDVPTWLGAYEKAVAEGNNDDRAIALADQAVIDSQGGGTIKDLSAIQRGGSGQKLFTNFYSFFNTTYNRAAENYLVTEFSNPLMVGRLAANYLLLFTVPVVWGWALKEALRGDDDDEDAEEIAKRLAMEQINYLLGTMVLAREIGSAISGFAGYQGPAGTRFFAEVAKLTKQIAQGDVDGALIKAAANTVGVVAHLPSGQVVKSVEGTVEFMDGNAGPQAVLVGPPLKN